MKNLPLPVAIVPEKIPVTPGKAFIVPDDEAKIPKAEVVPDEEAGISEAIPVTG